MALKLYLDSGATQEITDLNPDELKQGVESGQSITNEINLYLKSDDVDLTYENISIGQQSIASIWSAAISYIKRDGSTDTSADYVLGTDGEVYKCIQDHTSSTDDEPITGDNWATYWKLTKTVDCTYAEDNAGSPDTYSDPLSLTNGDYSSATPIWRKAVISSIAEAFIREDIRHKITADEYAN
jgi:hypothetical protein